MKPRVAFFLASLAGLAACSGTEPTPDPGPKTATSTRAPDPKAPQAVELAPGEVVELEIIDGHTGVTLATPTGKEQFVVVAISWNDAWIKARPEVLAPVGLEAGLAAPAEKFAARKLTGCSIQPRPPKPFSDAAAPKATKPPKVGARRKFNVKRDAQVDTIETEIVAVGTTTVVYKDISKDRPAEIDEKFAAEFVADFEATILPRARAVFGVESDIDGDGAIALLFTPKTRDAAVAYFSPCDLDTSKTEPCAGSNKGEVLYMSPPNAIKPPYNTPRAIKEILAHELEHLVHHNRKMLRNGQLGDDPESAYLLEGFGALAQDVSGFQSGNLYVTKAGLDRVAEVSMVDVLAERAAYDKPRDGALRGGAYLFVRWLYDRAGGDRALPDGKIEDAGGPTFVHAMLDARGVIAAELPTLTGAPVAAMVADFYTALAMARRRDDAGTPPTNACFDYLPVAEDPITKKQRGTDPYASFHGQKMTGPAIVPLTAGPLPGPLPGGASYFQLDASGGPTVGLRMRTDAPALRVRIGRIR